MPRLRALERFARGLPARAAEAERCEVCSLPIGDRHRHLVELGPGALLCACAACAVLFVDTARGARFRTVPDEVAIDPDFQLDDAEWAALGIPVRLAFVTVGEADGLPLARYPSPAGPVEAPVAPEAWAALAARTKLVEKLRAAVEALLIHRPRGEQAACFRAPIDACYELVGLVRQKWRGFEGGDEANRAIDAFVAALAARARPLRRSEGGRR